MWRREAGWEAHRLDGLSPHSPHPPVPSTTPKCPSHPWAAFYTDVPRAFFKVLGGEYSSPWEVVFGQAGSQMLALLTGQSFLVSDTLQCSLSMSPEGAGPIQVPPLRVLIWSFFPIIRMYSGHFLDYSSSVCSKFLKSATHWVPGTSRDHLKTVFHGDSACPPAFYLLTTSHWCSGRMLAREFFIYSPKCLPSSLFFFFLPLLKMSVTESWV